jgi:cytochrome c-type biogenesis protein CcmH/NrfG
LLLDRKRINKWAKWVALLLAVVFAGGFLFLGVGYGGAGFNLSSIFTGNKTSSSNSQTPDAKIAAYQAQLAQNPKDTTALLGLASVYQDAGDLTTAATYLEKVVAVDPTQKDVLNRLATIYLNTKVANYSAAAAVLNKLAALDPQNPDVYLKLGLAQNNLGHTEAAVLAWQKYLQLAPDGDMASVVKDQVDKLSKSETTTTGTGTSTTAGGAATTAGESSTTSGAAGTTATTGPGTTASSSTTDTTAP